MGMIHLSCQLFFIKHMCNVADFDSCRNGKPEISIKLIHEISGGIQEKINDERFAKS